jgi:5-methylcytosine-specific restriction endonuclease McrA
MPEQNSWRVIKRIGTHASLGLTAKRIKSSYIRERRKCMSAVENRKVLVLNRGWNPIAVVSLEEALKKVIGSDDADEPKARIIDANQDFRLFTWEDWSKLKAEDGEAVVRSAKDAFRIPEIILLSKYKGFPQQRVHFSRRTIYRRDGNQCQYCLKKPGTSELTIDHIVPRAQGGKTTWENCCLACTPCNRKKADRTPEQAHMKLARKPFKPKFTLYKGDYRCKSWEQILGVAYWETELESDNPAQS